MLKAIITRAFFILFSLVTATGSLFAQQPALIIQRFFTNPSGSDSPFEFAELLATRTINFSTETFTVVFADRGGIVAGSGWATGGNISYGFQIPAGAGTVNAGDLIYVGGSSLSINGSSCKILRQINTLTTAGDGFGSASAGVLGNGGGTADGLAVFNVAASAITNSTVPVDAVFFGTGIGLPTGSFQVPANDMYAGGTFGTAGNTALAPDPASGDYIFASSGTFYTNTSVWGTPRTWSNNQTKPNCGNAPTIALSLQNNLSLTVNTGATTSYLQLPIISGVINDPTDPASTSGIQFDVKDNSNPILSSNYTLTGASNNISVVPNSNILVTKSNGMANVKIVPSGAGYANITMTLTSNSVSTTYTIVYAASATAANPQETRFHTGISDASAAIALDDSFMLLCDDEKNKLFVYNRQNSGLALASFDYSAIPGLHLTDLNSGVPREMDLEAATRSIANPNRIYWLGSLSNQSTGAFNDRPNRNRLFAVDISGTGSSTAFNYVGDYEDLRNQIINWGTTNGLGLSASATPGHDPKQIDGFNIEGMAFAPDNTTMYIGFRAPLLPTTNRVNALIVPILNFETWFGTGTVSSPSFGSPVLLDLNGRGIRDIIRYMPNAYIIIAGDYDENIQSSLVYRWNGNPVDAPYQLTAFPISTDMNPEAILNVYSGNMLQTAQLQLVSDMGSHVYYNDAIAAKDLATDNFKKFRSDLLTATGIPLPVIFHSFDARLKNNTTVVLDWSCGTSTMGSYFEIEKSGNGQDFVAIGKMMAKGSQLYHFEDPISGTEGNIFYRIKAIEPGSEGRYTNIKMVCPPAFEQTGIYPNPVSADKLTITSTRKGLKNIRIRNVKGQCLANNSFTESRRDLYIENLVPGLYFLEISGEGWQERLSFVRQ